MANLVPSGVIVAWPGSAASIPAGWQRVTALSSMHTRGAAASVDPGGSGGAASHTHVSDAHTHSGGASHSHTATTTNVAQTLTSAVSPLNPAAPSGHTHTLPGTDTQTGTPQSVSAIWNLATVEPPYFAVIWIRSDGTPSGFPVGSVCYWPTSSPPSGWSQHSGSVGKYLKGADPSADGGGTGGSATHTHTAVAHSHTLAGHDHSMSASATSVAVGGGSASASPYASSLGGFTDTTNHQHSVAGTNGIANGVTTSTSSADTPAQTYDPPYTQLVAIVNGNVGADQPEGTIVIWTGTLAGIPFGYRLCDGTNSTTDLRSSFVRCAPSPISGVGSTGGSLGHAHSDPTGHTHVDSGHTHEVPGNQSGIPGYGVQAGSASLGAASDAAFSAPFGSIHGGFITGPASATGGTLGATAQDATSNADTRPPYVDIAFLAAPGVMAVTITAPGATVTTNNPTVSWTIPGGKTQESYDVTLFAADGVTVLWTSGLVVSATQSTSIPAGHLHNGLIYVLSVQSFTTDFYLGTQRETVTAAFTPSPTVTGVTATPEPDDIPPSVLVQWTQATVSAGQTYVQTNIERRVLGTTPWQQIGTLTAITTVSFRDYTAASGVTYEYAVTTTTNYGGDLLRSAEQSPAPQATLTFLGIWLHILGNPAVYLNYPANAGSLNRIQDQVGVPTWGRAIPTTHIGKQYWRTWTFTGIPIVYPGLPGAPGLPSAGTQDVWAQIDAFGLAAQSAGEDGVIVVRFGSMRETGYGIVDFGSANQSAGSSGGQTGRKDELGVYTPTLVIDEQFVDTAV